MDFFAGLHAMIFASQQWDSRAHGHRIYEACGRIVWGRQGEVARVSVGKTTKYQVLNRTLFEIHTVV